MQFVHVQFVGVSLPACIHAYFVGSGGCSFSFRFCSIGFVAFASGITLFASAASYFCDHVLVGLSGFISALPFLGSTTG